MAEKAKAKKTYVKVGDVVKENNTTFSVQIVGEGKVYVTDNKGNAKIFSAEDLKRSICTWEKV